MSVPLKASVASSGTMLVIEPDTNQPQPNISALRYPGPAAGTATFLGTDATTQGSWRGVYGADGYDMLRIATSFPSYAAGMESGGGLTTWVAASTSVTNAKYLQSPDGTKRGAYSWYSYTAFSYVVNCQDSAAHKVSIYFLDWDPLNRKSTVTLTDDLTGAVLGTQVVQNYQNGLWLSWNVTGNVRFTFSPNTQNAVISGVFFDGGGGGGATSSPLSYRVNGGPPVDLVNPIWFNAAEASIPGGGIAFGMPYVLYPLASKINPGDAVTISARAGSVSFASGDSAPATDLPASNRSGEDYLADPLAGARTMSVGYQGHQGSYYEPVQVYANRVKSAARDWANVFGVAARGINADGYPTGESTLASVLVSQDSNSVTVVNTPYVIADLGKYTLLWDGTVDCKLQPGGTTVVTEDVTQYQATGTNNRRVYNVTRSDGKKNAQLSIYIYWNLKPGGTLSNLRLFDKHITDPMNPPYFHPKMVAQLAGMTHAREKDLLGIDGGSNIVDPSDYPTPTWITNTRSMAKYIVPWTRLETYPAGQPFSRDAAQLLVTFPSPHPFKAGQYVNFNVPSGSSWTISYTLTYTDGTTLALGLQGVVYPTADPTKVVLRRALPKTIVPVDLSATPGRTQVTVGQVPPADLFRRPVALGNNCAPWVNFPHGAVDELASDWGSLAAAIVTDSRTIYVEYTNEWWNTGAGFWQSAHMSVMGREYAQDRAAAGDGSWTGNITATNTWYYVMRSKQLFERFKAAWVAAGRPASQLVHVLNTQFGTPSITGSMLSFANTHDSQGRSNTDPAYLAGGAVVCTPDMIAMSPYYQIGPYNSQVPAGVYDALTCEQVMDLADAFAAHYAASGPGIWSAAHKSMVAASASPKVKLGGYEGGPANIVIPGSQSRVDLLTVMWSLHPRIRRQFQAQLRFFQDLGFQTYTKLGPGGSYNSEGGAVKAYPGWLGLTQVAGKGDGSDGLADNRTQVIDSSGKPVAPDPTAVVSVTGQAMNEWVAGAAPTPTPPGPRNCRILPRTGGRIPWRTGLRPARGGAR